MGVYYCKTCKRYFFISCYWYMDKCRACDSDLITLPMAFVDFVELTEKERQVYISEVLASI